MSIPRSVAPSIAGFFGLVAPNALNAEEQAGSFEFTTTFDNKLITLHLDDDETRDPVGRVAEPPNQPKGGTFAFAGSVVGEMMIVRSTGDLFEVGETAPFDCVASGINAEGWAEVEAYCVTDHGRGDKWYRKSMRSAEEYDAGTGQMKLFGGTGKFVNLQGECTYEVAYVAPWSKGGVLAKCDWWIPDTAL